MRLKKFRNVDVFVGYLSNCDTAAGSTDTKTDTGGVVEVPVQQDSVQ